MKKAAIYREAKTTPCLCTCTIKNSDLWLLDEPFTSVDAQTEVHLFNTILTKGKDKTIVLITHKLIDLAKMDRIFVMNNGTLAESGTFEQLLTQRGLFIRCLRNKYEGIKMNALRICIRNKSK